MIMRWRAAHAARTVSSGAPVCKVAGCKCGCDTQQSACEADTSCQAANSKLGQCICNAQTKQDSVGVNTCVTTFGAIGQAASNLATCVKDTCDCL